jgi:hypothetical protein
MPVVRVRAAGGEAAERGGHLALQVHHALRRHGVVGHVTHLMTDRRTDAEATEIPLRCDPFQSVASHHDLSYCNIIEAPCPPFTSHGAPIMLQYDAAARRLPVCV